VTRRQSPSPPSWVFPTWAPTCPSRQQPGGVGRVRGGGRGRERSPFRIGLYDPACSNSLPRQLRLFDPHPCPSPKGGGGIAAHMSDTLALPLPPPRAGAGLFPPPFSASPCPWRWRSPGRRRREPGSRRGA
jgi:hypothetical protein